MDLKFGWKPQNEARHKLAIAGFTHSRVCALPDPATIPQTLDLPTWMQDDQLQRPFCHAHMRSGCEEILAGLASGVFPQYSRYYAAITDMRMDGDDRYEEGASISGSMRSAIVDGAAFESLKPYLKPNDRYSNSVSSDVVASAKQHHIKSLSPTIRSYAEMDALGCTGRYVFGFGLAWLSDLANLRGVSSFTGRNTGGQYLGEHAVLAFGWNTIGGVRHYRLHNSHGGWGVRMNCTFSPEWWDSILKNSEHGMWGASDIELTDFTPLPRDLSFKKPHITL